MHGVHRIHRCVYKRYTSEFYNILKFRAVFFEGSLLGCYRARRGGVGDDGGIQPEHSRALTDSWEGGIQSEHLRALTDSSVGKYSWEELCLG